MKTRTTTMSEDPDFLINLAMERIEFQLREQPEFQPTFFFRNDCQCGLTYPEQEGGAGDDFKDFMPAIRLLTFARNVIEGVLVGALQSTGDKSFVPFTDECIIVVHESRTRRKTLLIPVCRTANGDYDHLGSPIITQDLPWLKNFVPMKDPDPALSLKAELTLKRFNIRVEMSGGDYSLN